MNIYIEVEIFVREFERGLMLGTIAAARGHRVLIGRLKNRIASGKLPVEPGIYHAKSLSNADSVLKMLRKLDSRGFVITSQDEEHGLIADDYGKFARKRFSDSTLAYAERVFMWGEHDHDAVASIYPRHSSKLSKSGSPRVDLWRPDAASYFAGSYAHRLANRRPFILFVSNFGGPISVNDMATTLRSQQSMGYGDESVTASGMIEANLKKLKLLRHFVEAIRYVSTRFEQANFVVRPHPVERWGVWNDLVGLRDNVMVSRDHSIGQWINAASAVIQNGCTSAFEAAIAQRPLISYVPEGIGDDLSPNRVGTRAQTLDELESAVLSAFKGSLARAGRTPDERRLLSHRFGALEGRFASERIVDAWEELARPGLSADWSSASTRLRAEAWSAKNWVVGLGRSPEYRGIRSPHRSRWSDVHGEMSQQEFVTGQKFPPIRRADVDDVFLRMRRIGLPTDQIRADRLGPDMLLLVRR